MSLIRERRCRPEDRMSCRYSACFSFTSPNIRSASTSEKPRIAFSGVRSSWDMLARNSDLWRLAASSCRLLSAISRKRRAFWIARADWVANVSRTRTTSGGNVAGRLADDGQDADDLLLPKQRHRQERAIARLEERRPHRALVGAFHARCRGSGPAHAARAARPVAALAPWESARRAERVQRSCLPRIHVAARAEPELLGGLVVLEDRASVGPRQLTGAGDDRVEHRVEVERRADRAADLAQRRELLHRARQLARPRLQLLEQPHVLDGDDRLVGEGLEQRDLPVGEGPDLGPRRSRSRRAVCAREHRHGQDRPEAELARSRRTRVLGVGSSRSSMWMRRVVQDRAARADSAVVAAWELARSDRSRPPASGPCWAATCARCARRSGRSPRCVAPHSVTAFSDDGSKTGWTSVGELDDHPQDLAGRRLLLQGLGQIAVPRLAAP